MKYDKFQQDVLDWSGHLLLCTGRQIGKTFILGTKAAMNMAENKDFKILCISRSEDQAQLIIRMAVDYLEKHHKNLIDYNPLRRPTKTSINLKNGSWMMARPVGFSGDAVRGFTGNVLIMDEAAYFPDEVFISAKPVLLSTGGKLWIASTPKGKQGKFYEYFQNKNNRFKVIHASSEEILYNRPISEDWPQERREEAIKFLEEEKKELSEVQYGQEYLALFTEDLAAWFSAELINKCLVLEPSQAPQIAAKYLGVDVARMGQDETALEAIYKINDKSYIHFLHEVTIKQRITETADRISAHQRNFKFKKIGLDTGGVGAGVYDILLRDSATADRIVDLDNARVALDRDDKQKRTLLKEDMYTLLKAAMERGEIKLINNPEIRASLQSVQYEYVKQEGQLTKLRIFASYNHPVEALIRAYYVALKYNTMRPFVTFSNSRRVF